jgi:hypothetical protein
MTVRQAKAERVVDLINEAAAEFKDLHVSTSALGEAVGSLIYDKRLRDHGKRPSISQEAIPGMNTLPERVKAMVDYSMFGIGRNSVDLVQCITEENNAVLKEVNNG